MRGASLFPPTGQGRPAQLPDPCSASRSCPLARSLLGLWPQTGRQMGKDDPGSRPSPLSGLRAVPCVCASLFSSLWLMKYLGSLSCSPVSAFRFGFPDLSWGLGGGGQFRVSFPSRGAGRRDPTTGTLLPTPAWLLCRIFLSPVAFLAEHPRSCVEVGPGLPVSLHVLTKTPRSVPCPPGASLWGRGWPSCPQVLRVLAGPWSGAECPRWALQGSPTPGCQHTRHSHRPESSRPALRRLVFIFL